MLLIRFNNATSLARFQSLDLISPGIYLFINYIMKKKNEIILINRDLGLSILRIDWINRHLRRLRKAPTFVIFIFYLFIFNI